MSWEFVYCPSCGTDQAKIGGCIEIMFCAECSHSWQEPADRKGKKIKAVRHKKSSKKCSA